MVDVEEGELQAKAPKLGGSVGSRPSVFSNERFVPTGTCSEMPNWYSGL
jgi:hypothetical protein